MNSVDNDISNLYKLEFERTLRGANIYCDLIHFNKDLCFIHSQREVLHAIELCFKDKNISTTFKENDWSKALLVAIDSVPSVPPFENLIKHFLKCFLERLTIIEDWFNKHSISHADLLAKKQELLRQKKILYFHTHSLRALYETKRNNYTFNLPLVE